MRGFNGKPPQRQREAAAWEIRPDLSRKIYSTRRRFHTNLIKAERELIFENYCVLPEFL